MQFSGLWWSASSATVRPPYDPISNLRRAARANAGLLCCRVTTSQGVPPVKQRSADQKVIANTLLESESDTIVTRSNAPARLGRRQPDATSAIKKVSGTVTNNLVGSALQAMVIDEVESVCIDGAVGAIELPIIMPTRNVSQRIGHWTHSVESIIKEIKGEVPVFSGVDFSKHQDYETCAEFRNCVASTEKLPVNQTTSAYHDMRILFVWQCFQNFWSETLLWEDFAHPWVEMGLSLVRPTIS